MKTPILASSLTSLLLVAAAVAHADGMPSAPPIALSSVARAEVLADLQVWQRAGMDKLEAGEAGPEVFGERYRAALATYVALRNAPDFAGLVDRIARERGETVRIAGQ